MFIILVMVMVPQVSTDEKVHHIIYSKYMQFIANQLYSIKLFKK